jgi:hypothetical protein
MRAPKKIDPQRAKELRQRSAEHKKTVHDATQLNKKLEQAGLVSCAKLPYRFSQDSEKTWPNREGYMNVNVCSSSKTWKALSPMLLGPIEHEDSHTNGPVQVLNLENLWQLYVCF